ncbi:hypothetical protein AB0J82_19380 [Asanoa sp. NPDC049518]|uniref:hypothetical protein n=1 Tax=unclassified Asanoa TaxID=2685164 RepID=UPI003419CF47
MGRRGDLSVAPALLLDDEELLARAEVTTVNAFVHRTVRDLTGRVPTPIGDMDERQVWRRVCRGLNLPWTEQFLAQEFRHVILAHNELLSMVRSLRLGPLIAVHVVNTAMRIMSTRYPMELVRRPLPPEFDLRKLHPLTYSDQEHETAKTIFNQRTTSTGDLDEEDIGPVMQPLAADQQVQIFTALFFMFGSKVGAMKYRTGIP